MKMELVNKGERRRAHRRFVAREDMQALTVEESEDRK